MLAILLLALPLAACQNHVSGKATTLEAVEHRLRDGTALKLLLVETETTGDRSWNRVMILREGLLVGLTPLVRAARISCADTTSCVVHVLQVGDLMARAITVDPRNFFQQHEGKIDPASLSDSYAVPLVMDDKNGKYPGWSQPTLSMNASPPLWLSLFARDFPYFIFWGGIIAGLTGLLLLAGSSINQAQRQARSGLALGIAYTGAIGFPFMLFLARLAGGNEATTASERGFLGSVSLRPEGQSAFEPLALAIFLGLIVITIDILCRLGRRPEKPISPADINS